MCALKVTIAQRELKAPIFAKYIEFNYQENKDLSTAFVLENSLEPNSRNVKKFLPCRGTPCSERVKCSFGEGNAEISCIPYLI